MVSGPLGQVEKPGICFPGHVCKEGMLWGSTLAGEPRGSALAPSPVRKEMHPCVNLCASDVLILEIESILPSHPHPDRVVLLG